MSRDPHPCDISWCVWFTTYVHTNISHPDRRFHCFHQLRNSMTCFHQLVLAVSSWQNSVTAAPSLPCCQLVMLHHQGNAMPIPGNPNQEDPTSRWMTGNTDRQNAQGDFVGLEWDHNARTCTLQTFSTIVVSFCVKNWGFSSVAAMNEASHCFAIGHLTSVDHCVSWQATKLSLHAMEACMCTPSNHDHPWSQSFFSMLGLLFSNSLDFFFRMTVFSAGSALSAWSAWVAWTVKRPSKKYNEQKSFTSEPLFFCRVQNCTSTDCSDDSDG